VLEIRGRWAPIVVVLGCLGLTGCSGSDAAPAPTTATTASRSPTSTPSSTPTATAPALPAAARAGTRAGAEAFFRYFWDVYNYSYASLDTAPLRAISDPTCKFCTQAADGVESQSREEGRFEGGTVAIKVVVAAPGDPRTGLLINALIDQESSRVLDRDGKLKREIPSDRNVRVDAAVAWDGQGWHLLGIDSGKGT
jgi:Family of unknown function (DUF6318)